MAVKAKTAAKKKPAAKMAGPSSVKIQHYVTFFYPNVFVDDSDTKKVSHRVPEKLTIPEECHAFCFFDRKTSVSGGTTLKGGHVNYSGMYYIDGEVWTQEQVRANLPEEKVLLWNMVNNKKPRVVKTRYGRFTDFDKGDVIFRTKPPVMPEKTAKKKAAKKRKP